MAVATISGLLRDLNLDPGAPTISLNDVATTASETVLNVQGLNSAAGGLTGGAIGSATPTYATFDVIAETFTAFDGTATGDPDQHIHIWLRLMYAPHTKANGGVSLWWGSGGNDNNAEIIAVSGKDEGYLGQWIHFVCRADGVATAGWSTGAMAHTNITRAGLAVNVESSLGEDFIKSIFFDSIRKSDAAGNNGLNVVGGLTGDRITFADIAAADPLGNGNFAYGILRSVQGALFLDGDLHFNNIVSNLFLEDSLGAISCTDFPVTSTYYNLVGNASGTGRTTLIKLTSYNLRGVSAAVPLNIDMTGLVSGDSFTLTDCTIVFGGTIQLNARSTISGTTFQSCGDITPIKTSAANLGSGNTYNACTLLPIGASANLLDATVVNHNTATNVAFVTCDTLARVIDTSFDNTGGLGHAIELKVSGTYSLSGCTFTGYGLDGTGEAAIWVSAATGNTQIDVVGGGNIPTIRNTGTGTVTVNAKSAVTFTGMRDSTEVRVYTQNTTTELAGIENAVVGTPDDRSFAANLDANLLVDVRIFNVTYEPVSILGYKVPTTDASIPISQVFDRNYLNP